jgi:NAD(P)-dependent dehydrogenase (short-subunit alcohol dehydrogenase family)
MVSPLLLSGTFLTIQAVAQQMKRRGIAGSIVMTASMSGSIANKGELAVQICAILSSIDVLIPLCLHREISKA